jgi:hypothetical protein
VSNCVTTTPDRCTLPGTPTDDVPPVTCGYAQVGALPSLLHTEEVVLPSLATPHRTARGMNLRREKIPTSADICRCAHFSAVGRLTCSSPMRHGQDMKAAFVSYFTRTDPSPSLSKS